MEFTFPDYTKYTYNLNQFYAHESCGQCTPCREGTGYTKRIVASILKGQGHDSDLELLDSLCKGYTGTTICPLAAALASPVQSFIAKFRGDFEKAIARNPARNAGRLVETFRPGAYW